MLGRVTVDRTRLERLSRDECLRLLAAGTLGRIGFHTGALPVVLPVAYAADEDGVVVRVQGGSQLELAMRDAVVAFEIDDVDPVHGTAWSVAVTGVTHRVTDPADLARVRALPLDDWAVDDSDRFVRISLDLVSGRRRALAPVRREAGPMDGATAPEAPAGRPAAVAETHAGVVFLVGDRAYKLKKPLDLGFLDFRTREARLAACRREVSLNRRLAPDVYLGVADVWGPDGRLADHLVVMRRMPDDRRLSTLVTSGAPVAGHLDRLAGLLSRFHAGAATSPVVEHAATSDAVVLRWEANAAEMAPFRGDVLEPDVVDEVITRARRYLAGRQPLFDERIAGGRARDGHGDLLADDIFCLDDGPRVLDCLEFDDRLRHGDVLEDVAFLAMDLERLGRPDLAAGFLASYAEASGDGWPSSLADHYVAYRAQVRAKVACLRWAQGDAASRDAAVRLLRLCLDHLRRAEVKLVLVGGPPGTGKSTVAHALEAPLDAVVLRSDVVRKELSGVDPGASAAAGLDEGIYDQATTDATYAELLARAREHLCLGHTVVLDATWRHPAWRKAARHLAVDVSAELVELRCAAPVEVAAERVRRRLAAGTDASDATDEVARTLAGADPEWSTAVEIDTSGAPDAAVGAALARVGAPGRSDRD